MISPLTYKQIHSKRACKQEERRECMAFYDWYLLQRRRFLTPCLCFHIPNEYSGEYRPAYGAMLKRIGKMKGALDYICHIPGETFYLEFKSGTGSLSKEQIWFTEELDALNIPWYLVRGCEEAQDVLRRKGVCP